ncbi:MAG: T9SS type A sorting domain-containing protein [Bacteroidota bacterium]
MKHPLLSLLCVLFFSQLFAQNILFEEDFNGGLPADWSAITIAGNGSPSADWTWTNFGPMGDFNLPPLQSTTSTNGWVLFDSDLNCSQGTQDAWLVSPQLSAADNPDVFLTFQTLYQSFNDRPTVEVSTDSVNWTSLVVFPGIEANEFGGGTIDNNPQIINLDLSELVGNESTYWIAFRFFSDESVSNGGDLVGCGYSWQIDDVQILDGDNRPDTDLSIDNSFYAVAPNAFTPASQVEGIFFLADIINEGAQDQMDATLTVQVEDVQTSTVVFSEQVPVPFVGVDSVLENVVLEDGFAPDDSETIYEGSYNITTSTADEAPGNNRRNFLFGISDTIYSKWFETPDILIRPADDNSYAYGNCYYIRNGEDFFGRYVTFAVANAAELIGETVNILTYQWQGDDNDDGFATPDEYGNAPLAFNTYTFDGTEGDFITVPMSIDEIGIPLENNSYYFTVIQYESTSDLSMDLFASTEYDYSAMYIRSLFDGSPRYASMLDIGNTGDYSIVGFGFDVVPVVDISISPEADLVSSTRLQLSADNLIDIYPNPAKNWLTVDLSLTQAQDVDVDILNMQGQRMTTYRYKKLKQDQLNLNISALSDGLYLLQVRTKQGNRTLKFNITN